MVVEGIDRLGTESKGPDSKEGEGAVLELSGSIYLEGGVGLFRRGFLGSFGEIVKKHSVYRRLCVDDISDNGGLDFSEWYSFGSIMAAYYTWNLVATTLRLSNGTFILF